MREIEWNEPTGPHPCIPCKGTGQRRQTYTIGNIRIEAEEHQFHGQAEVIHD